MKRHRIIALVGTASLVVGSAAVAASGGHADDVSIEVPDGPRAPGLDLESSAAAAAEQALAVGAPVPDLTSFYVKHVHGQDFGLDSGDSMGFAGFCPYSDDASQVGAGIELPVGAVITSISAHFDDSDAGSNVSVALYRLSQAGTAGESFVSLASASSSGSGGNQEVSDVVSGGDGSGGAEEVDSNEFFHFNLIGSDSNERLCGVEVFFNVPHDDADLVFTPVAPCRIYDSRSSTGGAFAPNETRSFGVTGSGDFSSQGGSATGCDLPGISGSCVAFCSKQTKAVAVNLVAIFPGGGGQAQMWAAGGTEPSGALVNYIPGGNNSNAVVVEVGQCAGAFPSICPSDLSLRNKSSSAANLALVVTGYFTTADYTGQ